MAKEKVITVMCAARLPEMLVKRIDAAASSISVSRAQWLADACRQRLDGPTAGKPVSAGFVQPPDNLPPLPYTQVESTAYPGLERKPDMQALHDICAVVPRRAVEDAHAALIADVNHVLEVPMCLKDWWEDGNHYECLMDKGHKEQKHGLRGMVRVID